MFDNLPRKIFSARKTGRRRRSKATVAAQTRFGRLLFEPLEPRVVLNAHLLLSGPVISEFVADNDGGLADEEGNHPDWIELHNPTAVDINLDGWYLTDDTTERDKWQFPAVTLPPDGYLVVFASDKDRSDPNGQLHTNFKLSAGGEYLGLIRADGLTEEFAFAPTYPQQYENVSYGLSTDLAAEGYFPSPTPRAANLIAPISDPTYPVSITEIMYHPASENVLEEYIEVYNRGTQALDLEGWQIADGVYVTLPSYTLNPNAYVVVAADLPTFTAKYPGVTNVVGGWTDHLSNSGEQIEIRDARGGLVDEVTYADEGDWGVRELGPLDHTHRGWQWVDDHDGGAKSLELISLAVSNDGGQNWAASTPDGGTPGAANSAAAADVAPQIFAVEHYPVIPGSADPVTVTAELRDELAAGLAAAVHYRVDASTYDQNRYPTYDPASYTVLPMVDDGAHGDGAAGDGTYGAILPPQTDNTVVEFFISATDAGALSRTWPAPADVDGTPEQVTNLLYQVDDSFDPEAEWVPGSQPIYRIIMTESERARLADIGNGGAGNEEDTNAQMNATFVSMDGGGMEVRYNTGVRNRGHGTRDNPPNNYRVNFVNDRPLNDVLRLNINAKCTHSQLIGSVFYRMAGLVAPDAAPVQVRVNGENLARSGAPMYGSYVALEVPDSDFTEQHFPLDGEGDVYKGLRLDNYSQEADLRYEGEDPDDYRDTYFKLTNEDQDDWSDLIRMIDVLNNAPQETYFAEVSQVIDVEQWMRYLALDALLLNRETGLSRGIGDDYLMYSGVTDPRFVLVPHDLDSLMQLSGSGQVDQSIWRAADVAGLNRLLNHPDVTGLFYRAFVDLIEEFFNPQVIDPLVDQVLGPFVPSSIIANLKQFVVDRSAAVLAQIPQEFTVNSSLPVVDGYPHATDSPIVINGTAAAHTRSVLVDGKPADWNARTGQWQAALFGDVDVSGTILSFQDGASPSTGYDGTADTEIRGSDPTADLGAQTSINVDGEDSNDEVHALVRFDGVFGNGASQLGPGEEIARATLILNVTDAGNTMSLHRMLVPWDEAVNWDTFGGNGIQADAAEAVIVADATAAGTLGLISIDVTASVRAWQADPASNHGWVLLPGGTNGVDFRASDSTVVSARPELRIELADGGGPAANVDLNPGINRIVVETFDRADATGELLEEGYIDVWYDPTEQQSLIAGGTIATDLALDAGPYLVTGDLTVPAGVTLSITPGVTVYFDAGVGINVQGRVLAEGTPNQRIRLTRNPDGGGNWAGFRFDYGSYSDQVNRITYVDIEYSDSAGDAIDIRNGQLVLENVNFNNHGSSYYLDIHSASIIVRDSTFPDLANGELIHATGFPAGGYALFEGNWFGRANGYNDVIDFTGGQRPGPILRVINNYFSGGGDDGLDLDSTDAHIEGNIFVDFHQDGSRDSKSHAIATGNDLNQDTEVTIVRNLFYDVDHAIIIKDGAFGTIVNNTIVNVYQRNTNTNATTAAINFFEDRPPQYEGNGVYLDGNIFYNVSRLFEHLEPGTRPVAVTMNNSMVYPATTDEPVSWVGTGNLIGVDPLLHNPTNVTDPRVDFELLPGSPAFGAGPNGVDIGGLVPAGASISGEPSSPTSATTATLTVGGPHNYGYKYRLNEGPLSDVRGAMKSVQSITRSGDTATVTLPGHGYENGDVVDLYGPAQPEYNGTFTIAGVTADTFEITVSGTPASPATGTIVCKRLEPIELTGLTDGTYTVYVVAMNSAGFWQDEADATVSQTWVVDTAAAEGQFAPIAAELVPMAAEVDPATQQLEISVRDSYLTAVSFLVRAEVLDLSGDVDRQVWDATVTLAVADNPSIVLSTNELTLRNGLGSALVGVQSGSGDFTLTVALDGLQAQRPLVELQNPAMTEVSGTLPGASTTFNGVVHVTGDLIVPDGHTLTIDPGTLVLIDGVASGTGGTSIQVRGNVQSLGTAEKPVTFTAYTAGENWGEIFHDRAEPSLYQYTNFTQGGHSTGRGHTNTGPTIRTDGGGTLVFDHVNLTDAAGKAMHAPGGGDLTFRDSLISRSVMGPEIWPSNFLMEDTWITEMHHFDDADGIYIHNTTAGNALMTGGVLAMFDDDGIDTANADLVVEDYVIRDANDKGVSVSFAEVWLNRSLIVDNAKAPEDGVAVSVASRGNTGVPVIVNMDHTTLITTPLTEPNVDVGIWGWNKYNQDNVPTIFNVTNSIIVASDPVRTDYDPADVHVDYSNLVTEVWPGTGNLSEDPLFVDRANHDYRLRPGSASIDTGDPASPPDPNGSRADQGFFLDNVGGALAPRILPPVISEDTILVPHRGPYEVLQNVTVAAGATMTILPGTSVFFADATSLTVNGRLVAEGTKYEQIRFTRQPGANSWGGLQLLNTMEDNRISWAVLEHATTNNGLLGVQNSNLVVDHVTFDHAERRRIRIQDSSLIVRNSTFTDMFPPGQAPLTDNSSEQIWGGHFPAGGHFIIENNFFGTATGHNDVIDVDGEDQAAGGVVMQILGNTFTGGGDDALDLEGDAYIEGNTFMHFHRDQWNTGTGNANGISAGAGHQFVMVRNTFYDMDHVAQVKDNAFMTFVNNTVVGAVRSGIYFRRPGDTSGPGRGAYVDGNIFVDTPVTFDRLEPTTDLTVNRSILPAAYHAYGTGNLDEDPRLTDPAGGDFSLLPGSPAIDTGPNGLDMGARVAGGASISGEPPALTAQDNATLTIAGPGITHYRARVNGGAFGAETPVATPFVLAGQADDVYTVEVVGKDTAGAWQDEPTTSKTWTVNSSLVLLQINEVLAVNTAAVEHEGTYPDLIELVNRGAAAIDLTDMSISDNDSNPRRFVFPANTSLAVGEYLVLYADDNQQTSGLHLGFALDGVGEGVYLYDTTAAGGGLLDSVEFGPQLADLSVGRVGHDGDWALTQPTFGTANLAQPTGNPATLTINEWLADGDVRLQNDFVELYNPDPLPVALAGLHLTDNPVNQPTLHQIAPLSFVPGGGAVAFVADGDPSDGPNHLNFRLSVNQEMIGLFDSDSVEIDKLVYSWQTTDFSQGRNPDGSDQFDFFRLPNPGIVLQTDLLTAGLEMLDGLRITEMMYNPIENDDLEFVELQNIGGVTLDLAGVRLADAINFTFPPLLLAPGQSVVIVRDIEEFETFYGTGINLAGRYAGNLSNGGEDVVLQLAAPLEAAVLRFEFDDVWHPTTDGGGFALEIVDPATRPSDWSKAASWQPGTVEDGTPGTDDGLTSPSVVINEVLSHTDFPLVDSIELHNVTDAEINIGGWYLSDSAGNWMKYQIVPDTMIPANGYLVFDEYHFNPTPLAPGPNDFALDGAYGDDVWLVAANAEGYPTGVVDHVTFGAQANGQSWGRWPDGSGPLYPMETETLWFISGANSNPWLGEVILSEIHYNPGTMADANDLEFVEIYNTTGVPVDLADWRLRKGVDFDFADGMLGPYAPLVIVRFDPDVEADKLAAFTTHHNMQPGVEIVGPYKGRLSDTGERVQLQRPDEPPADEPNFYPGLLEDEAIYNDEGAWPLADGTGDSLNRTPGTWGNDATSWTAALPTPGVVESGPHVAGRHIFYNFSSFDGNDPGANATDDAAIATDKTALLPGQTATFANYTSYSRGINGIMIDLAQLADGIVPTADDFLFRTGNDDTPGGWTPVTSFVVDVRAGAGRGGSDRVTITLDDLTVRNTWLEVTVLSAGLALPGDDIFYFGNAVAEAGNASGDARVTAADLLLARNNPRSSVLQPAAVDFAYDYDRDGDVNATDVLLARNNQTNFLDNLRLIDLSVAESPAAAEAELAWLIELSQDTSSTSRDPQRTAVDAVLATYWQ